MEMNIPAYLVMMGISLVCASVLFWFSARKHLQLSSQRAAALSGCAALLSVVFGLFGAKLFYFIFRFSYFMAQGPMKYWLSLRTEELSYYGGVAGVCFAVFLAAKLLHLKPVRTLNAYAPAGALLAALARFAEYFISAGLGPYLDDPLPFPLAVSIVWSEDYTEYILAVFFFEGLVSLVAFVLSIVHGGEPARFVRTLFYLCLPQIILESFRTDSIKLLLVRLEQLVCYLYVEGVLIWIALKQDRRRFASWMPAVVGLAVGALLIAGEFTLEGKIMPGGVFIPRWITYLVMTAGCAVLAVVEHIGIRRIYSPSVK